MGGEEAGSVLCSLFFSVSKKAKNSMTQQLNNTLSGPYWSAMSTSGCKPDSTSMVPAPQCPQLPIAMHMTIQQSYVLWRKRQHFSASKSVATTLVQVLKLSQTAPLSQD